MGMARRIRAAAFVVVLASIGGAYGQSTTTIFFDGAESGITNGATDFSYMGSNWSGGFVASQGVSALYASGARSYHIDSGTAEIIFDDPVDSITFFYVHGSGFPAGTATAFEGDTSVGTAESNLRTTFGDSANFVTLDPVEPIDRLDISGGVIDNFSYTTLPTGPTPLEDPIPESIVPGTLDVSLTPFVQGLASPIGVRFPDDGTGRAFVFDQAGRVEIVKDGSVTGTLLDVTGRIITLSPSFDERGLLGFALHPAFSSNGLIYTYTSEPDSGAADFEVADTLADIDHQSVVAEWEVVGDVVVSESRRELFRIDQPQFNHNAGAMHFGPDGYLYIAVGDGGGADDDAEGHGEIGHGQDTDTIHGSLMRIDVSVDAGDVPSANGNYAIPPENPFVGTAGLDEIFAYGFRNPFQFSFDDAEGTLWLGDVGQNDVEELNHVVAGGNYGWNLKEGSFVFHPNGVDDGFVTEPMDIQGLIDPVAEYDHDEGLSIIGGFVYRGAHPLARGLYLTGDFSTGFVAPAGRMFYVDDDFVFREMNIDGTNEALDLFVKGFAQDLQGEVYVCTSSTLGPTGTTGTVWKITVDRFVTDDTVDVRNAFDFLDTNDNGLLGELESQLDGAAFDNADGNGDGFLSMNELLEATVGPSGIVGIVHCDFNFEGEELGTEANPFNSLREAVNFVQPGGTVSIASGNSPEAFPIRRAVRLVAAGGSVSIGTP